VSGLDKVDNLDKAPVQNTSISITQSHCINVQQYDFKNSTVVTFTPGEYKLAVKNTIKLQMEI